MNPNRTMTVTYRIRDEAVWSDGVPISGDDFQFTMDTALAMEKDREFESDYTNAAIIASEVGDKTFSLTLRRPTMKHEALFQWLIPKHAVEGTDFQEVWNTTTWPSGGPFILDTFEQNKTVTLVRNDKYWKTDPATGLELPYLDRVEFVFIPETEDILDAFTTRNVDVIQPPPNVDWIKRLESQGDKGAVVEVLAGPVWEHINFQFSDDRLELSPNSCNDNLAFRRAIAHAIDREAAAEEAYRGYGRVMQSYVEAYTPSLSTGAWSRYDYNPETARALYQLAVEETGIECAAVYHTTSNGDIRIRWAKMFAEMMEDAGIPFDLDLRDSSVFFGEMLDDGTWDIGEWAWVGSPGLAGLIGIHDVFDPNGLPPKGSNFYRWGTRGSDVRDEYTKRFAEIVKEMNATVDETEIIALVREAEEILADQVVIIPLSSRLVAGAVWADEIGGFKMNPSQASHTWNIEFWYRTDR
ncbi:MAG: ABC transporter substrate-binding protein [Acidimicrobiia bacterium]